MKAKLKRITQSKFARNVVIVAGGAAGAQVIALVFMPAVTRLYGPEVMGVLGVFTAILGMSTPFATFTYPMAIVLPAQDDDAACLVRLSLGLSLITATLVGLFFVAFGDDFVTLLNLQLVAPYIWLIPVAMLFSAGANIGKQWLIRKGKFSITARVAVILSLIVNLSRAGFGLVSPSAIVLTGIAASSTLLDAFLLAAGIRWDRTKLTSQKFFVLDSIGSLAGIARKYVDFPLYRAPEAFISAIGQSLPVLMLAALFEPASAGFYSIGRTVLGVPSVLIAVSVGNVFYPRISEAARNGENLARLISQTTAVLAGVGILPFAIVVAYGPALFGFVFGDEWVVAGEYARWMAVWLYFQFINQPSVRALPVLKSQRMHLAFTIFSLLTSVLALAAGYFLYGSDIVAVAFFSLSGAILNIVLIIIVVNRSRCYPSRK